MSVSPAKVSYRTLFFTFMKMGVMLFGGGYAMLPILEKELVQKRGWITNEDIADYYAIGQCTPGVIAVNTSTFIGAKLRGVMGGIVATLGFVFPAFFIIMMIAGLISNFSSILWVQKAFVGIRVCVCVLIAKSIMTLWKSAVKGKIKGSIFLLVVGASLWLHLSPVVLVCIVLVFAIVYEGTRKPSQNLQTKENS